MPDRLQMIRELVATPSVSSTCPEVDQGNIRVIELMADWLADAGCACELIGDPGNPAKANLVATLGGGSTDDDALILAGHSDTVPYDDQGWDSDPFQIDIRDGRIYGLGTADMKAFLALCVETVSSTDASTMKHPLKIVVTADEECGMDGARLLAERFESLGRHAVIGEPTALVPVRGHKGIFMERLRVSGRAGHSSKPALGCNAIDGMQVVLQRLSTWRRELQADAGNNAFEVPWPTVNPGRIAGGDSPNRIPAACELDIDLRFPEGHSIDSLRNELHRVIAETPIGDGLDVAFEPLFSGIEPMQTAEDAAIVRAAEQFTGRDATLVEFATEGPFFTALGAETVILGPGDIDCAHQPNEYVEAERLESMQQILAKLVHQFCF